MLWRHLVISSFTFAPTHGPLFRAGGSDHGPARRGGFAVDQEVHGFRYFDDRDLIGFVDGTENPAGQAAIDAAYVGAENAVFAGGSYVIVQKYLHDLAAGMRYPLKPRSV